MRPAQKDFKTHEEWYIALSSWMSEPPTVENEKLFYVFDGDATAENFIFHGTVTEFSEDFASVETWEEIQAQKEDHWAFVLESDEDYEEIHQAVIDYNDARLEVEEEYLISTYYDNSLYDPGGHFNKNRYEEYADLIRDEKRFED